MKKPVSAADVVEVVKVRFVWEFHDLSINTEQWHYTVPIVGTIDKFEPKIHFVLINNNYYYNRNSIQVLTLGNRYNVKNCVTQHLCSATYERDQANDIVYITLIELRQRLLKAVLERTTKRRSMEPVSVMLRRRDKVHLPCIRYYRPQKKTQSKSNGRSLNLFGIG